MIIYWRLYNLEKKDSYTYAYAQFIIKWTFFNIFNF